MFTIKDIKFVFNRMRRVMLGDFRAAWADVKFQFQYTLTLMGLRKYVPLYGQRTADEHDEIRRRLHRRQVDCDHLKGGRIRMIGWRGDYNISCHTYIDGTTIVKCLSCKKTWNPEDPEARKMLRSTTNTQTSSEVMGFRMTGEGKSEQLTYKQFMESPDASGGRMKGSTVVTFQDSTLGVDKE